MKKNSFIFTLIAACLVLFAACTKQNEAENRALFVGDYNAVLNGTVSLKENVSGRTMDLPFENYEANFSIVPDGEGNKVKLCAFDTTVTATVKSATLMELDSTSYHVKYVGEMMGTEMSLDVQAQLLSDQITRNGDTLNYKTDFEADITFNDKPLTATGSGTIVATKLKVEN